MTRKKQQGAKPANLPKVDNPTARLARAIARATAARGSACIQDGIQAGFPEAEVKRLWDDAMVEARRIEPRIDDMTVQS